MTKILIGCMGKVLKMLISVPKTNKKKQSKEMKAIRERN
jgi:hypothetical protein